jgi:BMFP domain-containing protein YqiC
MSQTSSNPLDTLIGRLRESLSGLAPEAALERMRPVLDGFFDQFQLVPRRDYDAYLEKVTKLEEAVHQLEDRIADLERQR